MYNLAKKEYAAYGVDTEAAIAKLKDIPVSIHCWHFISPAPDICIIRLPIAVASTGPVIIFLRGGIQTTGNYAGRARNFEELKADIKKAFSLMGGTNRLNLHASYAVGATVDRDKYEPKHFAEWDF